MKEHESLRIAAYGFDKAAFKPPSKPISIDGLGFVFFVGFAENICLETFDGVIIPQGIFEDITKMKSDFYQINTYTDQLHEREKQIRNLLNGDKWVCFLVDEIIDTIRTGHSHISGKYIYTRCDNTDLCKLFLNHFNIKRSTTDRQSLLIEVLDASFEEYNNGFGTASTVFQVPAKKCSPILKIGTDTIGFSIDNRILFLPFHTANRDIDTLDKLVRSTSKAIVEYIESRKDDVPEWLNDFQFDEETKIYDNIKALKSELEDHYEKANSFSRYKTILTTQSDVLRTKVIDVLENYFGLSVDPTDEGKEDAKILDAKSNVISFIEVKGTIRGVKMDPITQLNRHRERQGLDKTMPGMLIINSRRDIENINERFGEDHVESDQIKYAKLTNITIIRTIDLLYIMKQLEACSIDERRKEMHNILNSGGGCLRIEEETYRIVQE